MANLGASSPALSPYYQQAYQTYGTAASNTFTFGILGPQAPPTTPAPTAAPDDEMAWLRRRVNELCWRA